MPTIYYRILTDAQKEEVRETIVQAAQGAPGMNLLDEDRVAEYVKSRVEGLPLDSFNRSENLFLDGFTRKQKIDFRPPPPGVQPPAAEKPPTPPPVSTSVSPATVVAPAKPPSPPPATDDEDEEDGHPAEPVVAPAQPSVPVPASSPPASTPAPVVEPPAPKPDDGRDPAEVWVEANSTSPTPVPSPQGKPPAPAPPASVPPTGNTPNAEEESQLEKIRAAAAAAVGAETNKRLSLEQEVDRLLKTVEEERNRVIDARLKAAHAEGKADVLNRVRVTNPIPTPPPETKVFVISPPAPQAPTPVQYSSSVPPPHVPTKTIPRTPSPPPSGRPESPSSFSEEFRYYAQLSEWVAEERRRRRSDYRIIRPLLMGSTFLTLLLLGIDAIDEVIGFDPSLGGPVTGPSIFLVLAILPLSVVVGCLVWMLLRESN